MFRWLLIFGLAELLAMAWLLRDRQSVAAASLLSVIVVAIWMLERRQLGSILRDLKVAEPELDTRRIWRTFYVVWGGQVLAAFVFWGLMRVHTLPPVFELVACHVIVCAVVFFIRQWFQHAITLPAESLLAGRPWWEVAFLATSLSPSCGLLSILVCKGLRLF